MAITVDMTKGVYRRLYAGMRTGKRINAVSVKAALLFWHLHAIADDFGNMHGEPSLVKSEALPRRKEITVAQIPDLLLELASTDPPLIHLYDSGGEPYIEIDGFQDIQPANKNGKRFCRFPRRVNPGESKIIQVSPVKDRDPHSVSVSVSDSPLSPPVGGKRNRRLSREEKQAATIARLAKAGES